MVINCKVLPWIVAGIALAAILLIVLVMVTQAAPYQSRLYTTNLLANPGFEYGLTGWSVGYYSTQVTISLGSGLCPVHCGSYAAQGTPTYNDDAYVTQTFQWDGGDLYASAWMQSRYFDGYVHGYVALDGPNDEHVISEIDLTWNEWRRISISQTGAASGTWTVSAGTPKSIYDLSAWIDDVWVGDMDNTNPCMQPIPQLVSYQGQVDIGGMPFSGTGYFRFAIVDPSGTFYFWSNDGTDAITPTNAVTLTVVDGIFNTLLGETNPITYGVFSDSDRWLRVWFDDGTHGIQLLEPDTQFTTAPFAFQADHSTTADTATSAAYAITAGDATTALNATNAMTATYATTAGDATTALTATNATTATYATTALTATNATTATYATTALTATNATTATYATTALTATNATTATYATTALTATNATTATYATTALTATNATIVQSSAYSGNTALGARVYTTQVLTVSNGAHYVIPFDLELFDTNSIHSSDQQTMTCNTSGIYVINGAVRFSSVLTGTRMVGIWINGVIVASQRIQALTPASAGLVNVSTIWMLNNGDAVTLRAWQDSGISIQIAPSGAQSTSDFAMVRIP